jgi:hypothetical protein
MTEAKRRQYIEKLQPVHGLPDRLEFLDGSRLRTAAEWKSRRAEILQLYEKHDIGTFRPKPKLARVATLDETACEMVAPRARGDYGKALLGPM